MAAPLIYRKLSGFGNQIQSQLFKGYIGVNAIFRICGLFSDIERGDEVGVVRDVKIAVFISVIYPAVAAVDLGAFGDKQSDDALAIDQEVFWGQVARRI